jgi:hypothetical protein
MGRATLRPPVPKTFPYGPETSKPHESAAYALIDEAGAQAP